MAISSFVQFNEMHTSFLQEIGNMGAGNAATALSDMIGAPTDISVPQVKILSCAEACKIADLLSSGTAAYLISVSGDLKGCMLFVFPFGFVERLAGTFFPGVSVRSRDDMDEMVSSVIMESVNIVAAAYANNYAIMSGMMVDISVPQSVTKPSVDIAASVCAAQSACFISNSIIITDCGKSFNVLFFPELETIKLFMGKLGIEC